MSKGISGFLLVILFNGLLFLFGSSVSAQSQCYIKHSDRSLSEQIIHCEAALASLSVNKLENVKHWIHLSSLYRNAGDTNKSEKILLLMLEQPDLTGKGMRYELIYNLGINAFFARQFTQSFDYFRQAFRLALELEEPTKLANTYNALANLSQVASDYGSMSLLLEKALVIYTELNDLAGIAKVQNNLGNAYRYNHKYNQALVSYRHALFMHQRLGNELKIAHTQLNMARTFVALQQQEKAVALLNEAKRNFVEKGAIHRSIEVNGVLADIALVDGNVRQVEKHLAENKQLKLQIDTNHFDPGSELVLAQFYIKTLQTAKAEKLLLTGVAASEQQKNVLQLERYLKQLARFYSQQQRDKQAQLFWQRHSEVLAQRLASKQSNFGELKNILSTTTQGVKQVVPDKLLVILLLFCGSFVLLLAFHMLRKRSLIDSETTGAGGSINQLGLSANDSDYQTDNLLVAKQADSRTSLIELMMLSLQLWEQDTHLNQIELAEKSKVWKVSIDDGRVRARAMERYFHLDKLPVNPRWRNVVRTCHFVLSECQANSPLRDELSDKLQAYLHKIKQQATS